VTSTVLFTALSQQNGLNTSLWKFRACTRRGDGLGHTILFEVPEQSKSELDSKNMRLYYGLEKLHLQVWDPKLSSRRDTGEERGKPIND
jgi:hypothetical protein